MYRDDVIQKYTMITNSDGCDMVQFKTCQASVVMPTALYALSLEELFNFYSIKHTTPSDGFPDSRSTMS